MLTKFWENEHTFWNQRYHEDSGPNYNVPNTLQDKWFYLLGNHKNVSRVIWDKGEDREENIETMDIVTAIESFGGFVFSTETKTMPKEFLTMH